MLQEYSPEMRQISNSKTMSKDNGGVVLTRQIIKNEEVPAAVSTRTSTIASSKRNSVIPEPPKVDFYIFYVIFCCKYVTFLSNNKEWKKINK